MEAPGWNLSTQIDTLKKMIVRNINDKEVLETTYRAHGGAIAQMILDRRTLEKLGFLAIARLEPAKIIESHVDPMEEIYFVASGTGVMQVDDLVLGHGFKKSSKQTGKVCGSPPPENRTLIQIALTPQMSLF